MLRLTGHDIDTEPRLNLITIDSEIKTEWIKIPIKHGVVCREHLEAKEKRDERMSAFVEQMDSNEDIGLDFTGNLENYIKKNKIEKPIENKIWEFVQ